MFKLYIVEYLNLTFHLWGKDDPTAVNAPDKYHLISHLSFGQFLNTAACLRNIMAI